MRQSSVVISGRAGIVFRFHKAIEGLLKAAVQDIQLVDELSMPLLEPLNLVAGSNFVHRYRHLPGWGGLPSSNHCIPIGEVPAACRAK